MTRETFIADNIYKTRMTITKRVGNNLAVCRVGKLYMLYHVPSGKTVQPIVEPFKTVKNCAAFGSALIEQFPFLDDDAPKPNTPFSVDSYAQFIEPWKV